MVNRIKNCLSWVTGLAQIYHVSSNASDGNRRVSRRMGATNHFIEFYSTPFVFLTDAFTGKGRKMPYSHISDGILYRWIRN